MQMQHENTVREMDRYHKIQWTTICNVTLHNEV